MFCCLRVEIGERGGATEGTRIRLMITVVIDSNIVHSKSKDFTIAHFFEKIKELTDELEAADLYEYVQIAIPLMVVEECRQTQYERYFSEVENIRGLKIPDCEIRIYKDYETFVNRTFDDAIQGFANSLVRIGIIPFPLTCPLNQIITRAVMKKAPFEGKEGKSDKGFKDVIIWESLMCYKRDHMQEVMVLYSNDSRVRSQELNTEYSSEFGDEVHFIKKDGSSHNALLGLLAQLSKIEKYESATHTLESRLMSLLTDDNPNFFGLFEDDQFIEDDIIYDIRRVHILSSSIAEVENIDERATKFHIQLEMEFEFTASSDDGYSRVTKESSVPMEIIYSFEEDKFLVGDFHSATGMAVTFEGVNYEL